MSKITVALAVLALAAAAAGLLALATWEIPAPTAPVEKVIPDDKFPR